ncbi:hypothetical protein ABFV83_07265 [Lacrimispora sp. BS-2]|uniref:Uncharacterized protein n=1 Tax=Lacrimispora sp. BS-2 TaxID=3151850 RepID=A0AAU7PT99_9FIRM
MMVDERASVKYIEKTCLFSLLVTMAVAGCSYGLIYFQSEWNWVLGIAFTLLLPIFIRKFFSEIDIYWMNALGILLFWCISSSVSLYVNDFVTDHDIFFDSVLFISIHGPDWTKSIRQLLFPIPVVLFAFCVNARRFKVWNHVITKKTFLPLCALVKTGIVGIILGTSNIYGNYMVYTTTTMAEHINNGSMEKRTVEYSSNLALVLIFAVVFTVVVWKLYPQLKKYYILIITFYCVKYFLFNFLDWFSLLLATEDMRSLFPYLAFNAGICIVMFLLSAVISKMLIICEKRGNCLYRNVTEKDN